MTKTPQLPFVLVGLATAIIFGIKLDYLPLIFEEPRRALVSLEMLISGNYIVPRINGFEYYNKPPFYNWILIVFFKVFGTHEWVVRIPTFLSLFAIAGINYTFFKNRIGKEGSIISSLFFLLSGHVLFYFSFIGEIDITYSLIVYSQAIVFFYYHDKQKLWAMFGWSYALMTIGFMTKGLPSIAFQGLTIIGFALYYRKWIYFLHPANFLFLALSLFSLYGYFYIYSTHSDPLPYIAQLISESSRRSSLDILKILSNPFKVIGEFLKITFPWCLLSLPFLLKRNRQFPNKWITYGLLFIIANAWLYLISPGTRDRYLYMFLPFIYNAIAYHVIPFLSLRSTLLKQGVLSFSVLLTILFFYLTVELNASIWWPIICAIAFGAVIKLMTKKIFSLMLSLFAIMLLSRLAYDVIVFPSRKDDLMEISAKKISSEIVEAIGDESLYFYTTYSSKENSLPIFGSANVPRIERLPYDLSFYVSRVTKKPILATNDLVEARWYVTKKESIDSLQTNFLEFHLNKKEWVLFKK